MSEIEIDMKRLPKNLPRETLERIASDIDFLKYKEIPCSRSANIVTRKRIITVMVNDGNFEYIVRDLANAAGGGLYEKAKHVFNHEKLKTHYDSTGRYVNPNGSGFLIREFSRP